MIKIDNVKIEIFNSIKKLLTVVNIKYKLNNISK